MAIYTGRAMIDGGNEPGDPTPVSSTTSTITPVVAPIATATPDVVTPTTTPNPQLGTPHVPYAQLTAAQRAAMTPEEQLAYIHSDTVARQAAATIQRMSDPMTDPTNRPSAPPFKDGFIYYYGWIGGASSGNWVLYRATETTDNIAKYGSMAFGGPTQATANSAVGANALKIQPTWNAATSTWSAAEGSNAVAPGGGTTLKSSGTGSGSDSGSGTGSGTGNGTGTGGTGAGSTGVNGTGTGAAGNTPIPGGSINANPGALQIITDALNAAGLGALATQAWSMWNKGFDFNAIMDDPVNGIRASADYKKNFPAMAALNAAGQGISESTYLQKEQSDLELMKQYGIPSGIFDTKEYLGSLMTNNVNTTDLEKRLMAVQNMVDPNVSQYAKDTYGLDTGHLMAYLLDPKAATPVLLQKAQAMQIGGAAYQQKFAGGLGPNGELSQAQAEELAMANVTQSDAQKGFANIGQEGQLAQALPGDTSGSVSNQQLINAQFNLNPNDIIATRKVQQNRINEFNAGGAVAGNANGLSGLGKANAAV